LSVVSCGFVLLLFFGEAAAVGAAAAAASAAAAALAIDADRGGADRFGVQAAAVVVALFLLVLVVFVILEVRGQRSEVGSDTGGPRPRPLSCKGRGGMLAPHPSALAPRSVAVVACVEALVVAGQQALEAVVAAGAVGLGVRAGGRLAD
jgi:hypothetical protein